MNDVHDTRAVKKISSPERWEIKQMIAANVIDKSELPEFDEELGLLPRQEDSGRFLGAISTHLRLVYFSDLFPKFSGDALLYDKAQRNYVCI